MSKLATGLLVALVLCALGLTGCGGGGGNASNPATPVDPTVRTITGKVVSSAGGAGVANVRVTVGDYSAQTGSDGSFAISMPVSTDIPSTFTVDVYGIGTGYSRDDLVTYNSQTYYYNIIDTPVAVRNGGVNALGTVTVNYSVDNTPTIPYPSHDIIITGRVVRYDNPTIGISGVTVRFGTATTTTTTTGAKGYFALNVGRDVDVLSLFQSDDKTFSIDTSGTAYASTLTVRFDGSSGLSQSSIPVPNEILLNDATDLGDIVVGDAGSGGDYPPPPPLN